MKITNSQAAYENFIKTHPEWHEYDKHCKKCHCTSCHHDLWGPPPHAYGEKDCRCLGCMEENKIKE